MAPLNSGHLIWFLRQRYAEETPSAELTARQLAVDRCALELNAFDEAVRTRALARLLQLAAEYALHPGYRAEWRR